MNKKIKKLIVVLPNLFSFLSFLLLPKNTRAQGIQDAFSNMHEVAKKGSYKETTINILASDIVQLVLSALGTLFVVFMVYAGYIWLTAAGNEQKVSKAKTILFQSIIGLIIVIAAYSISYFVISAFKSQVNI